MPTTPTQIAPLISQVEHLIDQAERFSKVHQEALDQVRPSQKLSARNLLHYISLRSQDIRPLQQELGRLGVSRLGRAEAHVMASLSAVRHVLYRLHDELDAPSPDSELTIEAGIRSTDEQAHRLLGPRHKANQGRVMVTMPTEAGQKGSFIPDLVEAGMTAARINCAKDGPEVWERIVHRAQEAAEEFGRPVKICMDLGGPKLRTGNLHASLPNGFIKLWTSDHLWLTRANVPGMAAVYDSHGNLIRPAQISCTLPEVFDRVQVGDPVLFNDGKIEGKVVEQAQDKLVIEITFAKTNGAKLRPDKGINFPQTDLGISGLTAKDRQDLDFVAKHAHVVSLSFVNKPDDVLQLIEELKQREAHDIGILLKIETRAGYENLPNILLTAMRHPTIGVMIARGDLAVEVGWQEMALIQEEIIRLCAAAHVPVVWATQVLESLAQKGQPSRSEISDAAMARSVECVMLNKGPFILEAVKLLGAILMQLEEFHAKTAPMLPRLQMNLP